MKLRNRSLWLAAVILAILLAAWGYRALQGAAAPELSRARVERADLEETITAQGKLEPKEYVDVGAQVSGQLARSIRASTLPASKRIVPVSLRSPPNWLNRKPRRSLPARCWSAITG